MNILSSALWEDISFLTKENRGSFLGRLSSGFLINVVSPPPPLPNPLHISSLNPSEPFYSQASESQHSPPWIIVQMRVWVFARGQTRPRGMQLVTIIGPGERHVIGGVTVSQSRRKTVFTFKEHRIFFKVEEITFLYFNPQQKNYFFHYVLNLHGKQLYLSGQKFKGKKAVLFFIVFT